MKNAQRLESWLQFLAVGLFLVLLNVYGDQFFVHYDLTEEKRYTISDATKKTLNELDDVVYVEVYLEGDLNASFQRLRKSIHETLDRFRMYAGDRLQYKFINPDDFDSRQDRESFYQQLLNRGIQPTQLFDNENGKQIQKIIFPAASIAYRNKEIPLMLLKGNKTASAEEQLNQSIEGLEYEFASTIQRMTQKKRKIIAFSDAHNELNDRELADLRTTLNENYITESINLQIHTLDDVDALIIAQPKKPFSPIEKYHLDQFIMRGGKTLFFLDMAQMNIDSIAVGGTYAFAYDLNLNDLLFKYGVRLNQDLIQDTQMGSIILNVGNFGNQANLQPVPFPYYIKLNQFAKHPIVRNLNGIYSQFLGTIDTVKAIGIRKTPLIFTNAYTRTKKIPTMVSLDEVKMELDPNLYPQSSLPVAYLLEGKFTSLYKNRYAPQGAMNPKIISESIENQIFICTDGDILKNDFDPKTGNPLPLGFDKITQQTFSNKELIINILAYMLDENGLILTRNKQITLRPLDKIRVAEQRTYWQMLNLALPIGLVIIFGGIRYYLRKRKYHQK